MTIEDRPAFFACYTKLSARMRQKVDSAVVREYFEALEPLPLAAVEAAAVQMSQEGTSDNWFPRTPEWFQLAAERHADQLDASFRSDRALQAAPEDRDAEMVEIMKARARCLEIAVKNGQQFMIDYLTAVEPRLPSENDKAPYCGDCGDTGRTPKGDCPCADSNPVILARRIRGRHRTLITRRSQRAAQLRPSTKPFPLLEA